MRAALKEIPAEKTDFGPGKTPLYYNNKGLFSDPFIEERLPNLEKYSSHPSTKYLNKYWNCDEFDHEQFHKAFNDILNLWDKMDEDVARYCENEAQLEQNWIKPIFDILGWTYEVQVKIDKRGRKMWPDYSLFASQDAWKKSKNSQEIKKFFHATSVADAKAWDVSLDGKGYTNANPSFQIVTYMELTKKDWGILTNGREWRVYSLRSDSKHTTYFEIDLINILATKDTERFKYFYNFFRKEAFVKEASISDRCFLDFVFEDGQFYSQRVEENLQGHAYKVVDTICQGFLANIKNPTDEDLKEVYEYSMYYLFKLMFVLNCESKGLLEVNKQDDYYEFSLRKRVLDLKEMHEAGKNWSSQPRTYNYINDLFELLKHGDENIGVHGFGEEPFEIGSVEFYLGNKISDEFLNDALLDLACSYDEHDTLQFIDYKILSPDHIGSLFEGLLEFDLKRSGRVFELLNTKGERKSTGAFYTPDDLVDYIVSETLSEKVAKATYEEILNLKIIDPAMGSGHFLLGVVRYLEDVITKKQHSEENFNQEIDYSKLRKDILHSCVFGVDVNPLATELAKFSLWIFTSEKGQELEPLGDQLKHFDSVFCNNWENSDIPQKGEYDCVVGNPPFVSFYSRHSVKSKDYLEDILHSEKDKYQFLASVKRKNPRINLSMFFFELANCLVKDNGIVGLIGDIGFEEEAYSDIKKYLSENSTLLKYHSKLDLFKGVNSQQVVSFWQRKSSSKKEYSVKYSEGNDYQKTINVKTAKDTAFFLANLTDEINFEFDFLGNLFDINTGVNIGGASDRFLTKKKGKNTLPLVKPADFEQNSMKSANEIEDQIIFDQNLVEKVNLENKEKGSSNTVVLGDKSRFLGKRLFIKQSCEVLTSNIIDFDAACNYSVFVLNAKSEKDIWKVEMLHALLSTEYYNKLAWDQGIIKGGGGKQPQIRKGNIKKSKPGLATIPVPVGYFEDMKHILNKSFSVKVDEVQAYLEALVNNKKYKAA